MIEIDHNVVSTSPLLLISEALGFERYNAKLRLCSTLE
jgi:hypothetical protein